MDFIKMDTNKPNEESHGLSRDAVFKSPMVFDHHKLPQHSIHDSSGYGSACSPDLNATAGSVMWSAQPSTQMAVRRSLLLTPNVSSNDSLYSTHQEDSFLSSNAMESIEISTDSGVGFESSCSSMKDSGFAENDDFFLHRTPAFKRPAAPITSTVVGISNSDNCPKAQSTPFYAEAGNSCPVFSDSGCYESSPTKRQRASPKKLPRDLFQSNRRKASASSSDGCSTPKNSSFVGCESVDFLRYLGKESSFQPAVDAILGNLDAADLCRASIVSRTWKNIIESVPTALHRKTAYIDKCSENRENLHQLAKKSEGTLPFRGQLIEVQNYQAVPNASPRSPPVSPSKIRFHLYLKEGRKLENGQTLIQCPQCKLPSRKETERSARCTRRGCQYYFCILCLCKFHGDKICPVSTVRHRKRPTAIGSRESRRNLQRLCK